MDDNRPLPEDLLVEILLRLPVESLLRFKCVCKHWYALIKSPSFIEKHFHHKNNRAHLFICNSRLSLESRSIEFCLLPGKIVPGVTPERKTLHQLQKFRGIVSVVGPVDGLFLVQKAYNGDKDEVSLALWNPATREFRPLPPVSFDTFFIDYDDQVALGFDLLTQDYKVVWVRVCWDCSEQGFIPRVFVSIYSLRNNLWKNQRSEFPSCCNLINSYGATYLNGVYYWLTAPLNEVCRIRSFDIGNEQFGELQGPKLSNERWVKLMLHDESLALLLAVYPGKPMTSRYDLWVMIEEGRWTKVLTVKPLIGDHLPRAIWENDKMIFELTETWQLVLYDHTTEEVTDLGFQLDLMYGRCWVLNYKESLVSLKRGNVSQAQGQDDGLELMGDFFNPF